MKLASASRHALQSGNHRLHALSLAMSACLAGCAAPPASMLPAPLFAPPDLKVDSQATSAEALALSERRLQVTTPPAVPKPESLSSVKGAAPAAKPGEPADLSLSFDQLSLPNFIQVVFGQVMKKNFSMDPTLITRTDLVTLRTGQPQTVSQVLETTRLLLKSYGVAIIDTGGEYYRIVPDSNQAGYLPEIRRGRAQPDVPLPMRPVFNLVELSAVRHSDVSNWLKAMFGTRLNVQDDAGRNALLISGQSAEVTAALEAIQVLDQPLMRGRGSRLITPASLSADDLARRLVEILTAEGYAVGIGASPGLPISLVPVSASNALLVFTQDAAVMAHLVEWASRLDAMDSTSRRTSGNYLSYEVKYADAQSLAKTLQELMGVAQPAAAPSNAQIVIGAPRQPARVVVNPATNTLIVNTQNADESAQLLGLIRSLDRPAKSAMIEVTVAEVRVGDRAQLGLEWSAAPQSIGGGTVIGGTLGGISLGTGGLSLSYLNQAGIVRARLNALASESKARILSAPRVMARNGESATIQVGQEVPIITSQQSTQAAGNAGNANTAGVLQTIQYRTTGVILKVKPIIFAGRVELDVQQEVSSAASTSTGVNISPTFSTRKVDTKVSIRDGATVALGGLISRTRNSGNAGIPLLKDIPGLGQFFRTNTQDFDETELIILITPYVVENDLVAEQVTQALRGQLGSWAQPAGVDALTPKLTPAAPVPLLQPPAAPAQPLPEAPLTAVPTAAPQPAGGASTGATGVIGAPPAAPPGSAANSTPLPPQLKLPSGVQGKAVTDPALLEELRRHALGLPPAPPTASPAPVSAGPAAAPTKPRVRAPKSAKRATRSEAPNR